MSEKKAPTNTTTQVLGSRSGSLEFLFKSMLGGGNAIAEQEAEGQKEFAGSSTLPTRIAAEDKEVLESAGVKFLGPVEGDKLFQYVELPQGWSKIATDHSMWSDLVDERGRKRGSIFYKAAFYDRDAHLHLNRRYSYRANYDVTDSTGKAVSEVYDGDKVIHRIEGAAASRESDQTAYYAAINAVEKAAAEWLTEYKPEWRKSSAYWD